MPILMYYVTQEERAAYGAMTLAVLKARLDQETFAAEHPAPKSRNFAGLKILVENPAGSFRSGVGSNGKPWKVRMRNDYGYISRSHGSSNDGEGLDVFLGPENHPRDVYLVNQNHVGGDKDGMYDETKVMLGYKSASAAKTAYLLNYSSPKFYRSMTIIPIHQFREMLTGAEPGSVHWKRKQGRELDAVAMFSGDSQ
jgi:Inorganic Pyrophosphatase